MGVVRNAELVGNGEQQGVGLANRLIASELFDQGVWLSRVAPPEDGSCVLVNEPDLILLVPAVAEVGPVGLVNAADTSATIAHCVA